MVEAASNAPDGQEIATSIAPESKNRSEQVEEEVVMVAVVVANYW